MKLIYEASPPHPCLEKIREFANPNWYPGTIVSCDCGLYYQLNEARAWAKVIPGPVMRCRYVEY